MGRRSTGTVEPLKTSIRLLFTVHGQRQREPLSTPPTPANMKAAHRLLQEVQRAITLGVYRREDFFGPTAKGGAPTTFSAYADEWVKTLTVSKSTRKSYAGAMRCTWKPAFGDRALAAIRYSDVKKVIVERIRPDEPRTGSASGRTSILQPAKPICGKSMNNYITPLRALFEMAVEDGLIAASPMAKITPVKVQAPEPDPFTREEMELLLGDMAEHYPEQALNWFEFAFCTGLRPSEEIALAWSDIDWRRRKLNVTRAFVERELKGTKTNTARVLDLSDRAIAVLQRQKVYTFLLDPTGGGRVFHNPATNRPWADEAKQRENHFIPSLRRLGLRHRDCYQTRHSFATLMLMGGVNPAYIARQLGHANARMLFRTYSRWIEDADGGLEAAKLNAILSRNCPRKSDAV